ncbi:MAG: serine/threonine protein kinase [Pirellulaceae bacterium]|nr:serine/threonine protein kinase [Pirellulaceae bacterium]
MDTDRNLLFGVLAFQAELIDAERFAEACGRWAAAKNRPLAEILVEGGWIEESDRLAVDHLVGARLRRHGGDAARSLAASCHLEARQILAALEDTQVRQSLAEWSTDSGEPMVATLVHPLEASARYVRSRVHAQGGLGRVWVARDRHLGRDVALKELLPQRAGSAELSARFVAEARITGQLQHPGIVPVYDLVAADEGERTAYYTMRFVGGRTLSEAIRSYHQQAQASGRDRLQLRDLLGVFVSVCNAVAYAHARGVTHRDLKGSNVVLGDFGEVIVLDWGLAKARGEADTASGETESAAGGQPRVQLADVGADQTQRGRVLGTPGYMSPEQAQGRHDQVGPASDIYSLGAVLYEILVGEPPFHAGSAEDILRQVVADTPAAPRSRWVQCPPALNAICLKALEREPAQRYATAIELADDVRRWLADEPVSVYAEPLVQRLARWSRRHRTLVTSAAALLLTALVGVSLGLVAVKREQLKTEQARQRAETNQQLARGAVDRFLVQVSSNVLLNEPGLQALRRQLLESAVEYFQQIADNAQGDPAARIDLATAYGRQAQLRFELGEIEKAFELNERARTLLMPPEGQQIRDGTQLTYMAMTYHNQATFHSAVGDWAKAAHCFQLALEMRSKLVEFNPDNAELRRLLAADYTGVGANLQETGQFTEALAAYEKARQLLEVTGGENYYPEQYQSDRSNVLHNLALIYRELNQVGVSREAFDEVIRQQRQLLERNPGDLHLSNHLIRSLVERAILQQHYQGQLESARDGYLEALDMARTLSRQNPLVGEFRRNIAAISNNLGAVHQQLGSPDQALQALREAIAAWRELIGDSPLNREYHAGLCDSLGTLGDLYRQRAEFQLGLDSFAEGARVMQALRDSHPDVPRYAVRHAMLTSSIGLTYMNQARWEEARLQFRKVVDGLNALRQTVDEPAVLESMYLQALLGLAEATSRTGQHEQALEYFRQGLELAPAEQQVVWSIYQAVAVIRQGDYQRGLGMMENLAPPAGDPAAWAHELACIHALAASRAAADDPAQAARLTERALELLADARQSGYYDQPLPRHFLRVNPDLDILRDRPEFQELQRAIEP